MSKTEILDDKTTKSTVFCFILFCMNIFEIMSFDTYTPFDCQIAKLAAAYIFSFIKDRPVEGQNCFPVKGEGPHFLSHLIGIFQVEK